MNKLFLIPLAGAALLATAFSPQKESTKVLLPCEKSTVHLTEYAVNTEESTAKWLAKKVTGEHYGTVNFSTGKLLFDHGTFAGGEFEINMESLKVTDVTDENSNQKLTGHLKSDDFFSTEKHKAATFKITSIKNNNAEDKSSYDIVGDMTIKGITKSIEFPAKVYVLKDGVSAYAKIEVNRTDFDIKYRSGSFFDDLGNKMIEDKFQLDIRIVAAMQ